MHLKRTYPTKCTVRTPSPIFCKIGYPGQRTCRTYKKCVPNSKYDKWPETHDIHAKFGQWKHPVRVV